MTKQHLKSLNTPRTWDVARKENTFTTRPHPGAHSHTLGYAINHIMKHELGLTKTTKETKSILNAGNCLVNGRAIKDDHYLVGFMDVVSFPSLKKAYRMTLDTRGKLALIEIAEKEAAQKLSKVTNKTILAGGKIQINTMDGRNILVDKDSYTTADSLVIDTSSQKIKKHIAFEKGASVILIGGKHIGALGEVEKIESSKILFKSASDKQTYETLKKYAFVVGKGKPEFTVHA